MTDYTDTYWVDGESWYYHIGEKLEDDYHYNITLYVGNHTRIYAFPHPLEEWRQITREEFQLMMMK
jgi:hypothetical protein